MVNPLFCHFKARLSRRIAFWVFLSIVAIEVVILVPSYQARERELKQQLRNVSMAKTYTLVRSSRPGEPPKEQFKRLQNSFVASSEFMIRSNPHGGWLDRWWQSVLEKLQLSRTDLKTAFVGGALYRIDTGELVGTVGQPPQLSYSTFLQQGQAERVDRGGDRIDLLWSPANVPGLNWPYALVLRHDSSQLRLELRRYVWRIALLVITISIFVTTSTMLVLGFTVINPILRLRDDLRIAGESAGRDDLRPKFSSIPSNRQDELGEVLNAFCDMYDRVDGAIRDRRRAEEESERLLLDILPKPIAERLKRGEHPIADRFDEVTVLFADLVNFTELSTRVPPAELVSMLDRIFSTFDNLADRHGLEKIKTIGDAYMLVGGLPVPCGPCAHSVAAMALDMQAAMVNFQRDNGETFALRIGIHTGPVVAGAIGSKKFAYDLWGDTVNTASRMESQGKPGKIQVSDVTHCYLQHGYRCHPRGTIEVKGKGMMKTFWLEERLFSAEPQAGLSSKANSGLSGVRYEPA